MAEITKPAPLSFRNLHDEAAHTQDQRIPNSPTDHTLTTLLVRHLPEAIPPESLLNLFTYYGAVGVRPYSSGRLRNCAFLDFKSQSLAYQAQRQLNGVRFLGKVLNVERANKSHEDSKCKQVENRKIPRNPPLGIQTDSNILLPYDSSRSETKNSAAPIAPRLGIDYPFPPQLEYSYPPPDGNILTNIMNALIAVPRFYTQVLHLMNKMNIPAPFRPALPTPPLPPESASVSKKLKLNRNHINESESESESESGSEPLDKEDVARRRKRSKTEHPRSASLIPKEIPLIKKKNQVLQIIIAPKGIQTEEKPKEESEKPVEGTSDKIEIPPKSLPIEEPNVNQKKPIEQNSEDSMGLIASPEEIQSKRLGPEEILSLPKFKNYVVGDPSSVLYIKNLDKNVVQDDFYYIFGSLFGSLAAAKGTLVVKLMQEGRMRGQAFVTFPSVDFAYRALNLVNGFVFKGKPIIIQFGRNSAAS